ncbi:MAG TPA: hypothetical protein VL793_01175, partial [Patescibacteria group bacterium]|nr:hypothetical protein [Patescibacteria group bacterium]
MRDANNLARKRARRQWKNAKKLALATSTHARLFPSHNLLSQSTPPAGSRSAKNALLVVLGELLRRT